MGKGTSRRLQSFAKGVSNSVDHASKPLLTLWTWWQLSLRSTVRRLSCQHLHGELHAPLWPKR